MKTWNDAELGALITAACVSREPLADPSAAARIATSPITPVRRWPAVLAAAAAVLLVIGGTSYVVTRNDSWTVPSISPTPGPTVPAAADADNLRAAAQASERVLRTVQVPTNARRLDGRPTSWPDPGSGSNTDPRLTRTAWFSTSLTVDQVTRFLRTHLPRGRRVSGADAGRPLAVKGGADGSLSLSYSVLRRTASTAYDDPALIAEWKRLGDVTVIRFEALGFARRARTAATFVSGQVTSLRLTRYVEEERGYRGPSTSVDLDVVDPAVVNRLVDEVNGLRASYAWALGDRCPYRLPTDYTLTFRTPGQEIAYRWRSDACSNPVRVSVDGRPVEPTLDQGDLSAAVDQVAADAR